jgi:hypothetical protein
MEVVGGKSGICTSIIKYDGNCLVVMGHTLRTLNFVYPCPPLPR